MASVALKTHCEGKEIRSPIAKGLVQNPAVWPGLAVALFVLMGSCSSYRPDTEVTEQLFRDAPDDRGSVDQAMRASMIRYRFVGVNFDLLVGAEEIQRRHTRAGSTLQLNLFEDAIFRAVLDRQEVRSERSFTWLGHIEGMPNSQVTLVVENGVMVGNIRLAQTYYQVRYGGEGTHVIYQIDPKAFPRESEPVVVPPGPK